MRVFSLPWHGNNILKHASVQEILYPVRGGKALISKNSIVFISILTPGVIWIKLFSLGPRHWLVLPVHSYVTASPQAHICQISALYVILHGDCLAFLWEGLR